MWKTPTIVEIPVGMEINAYACAELDAAPADPLEDRAKHADDARTCDSSS